MAEMEDLQTTDSANGTRVDALWPEGMPMGDVNDGGRADEGIIAREYRDTNTQRLSTGSGSAYIVSIFRTLTGTFPANFYDGLEIGFRPHVTNAASPTVGVGGAENNAPMVLPNGDGLPANCLQVGVPTYITWNSTNSSWVLVSFGAVVQANSLISRVGGSSSPQVIGEQTQTWISGFVNVLQMLGRGTSSAGTLKDIGAVDIRITDGTDLAEEAQVRVRLITGGTVSDAYFMEPTTLRPADDGQKDLGRSANRFRDLYLSGAGGGGQSRIIVDGDFEIVTTGTAKVNGQTIP